MSEQEARAFAEGWDAAQSFATMDTPVLIELLALAYLAGAADARADMGLTSQPVEISPAVGDMLREVRVRARLILASNA